MATTAGCRPDSLPPTFSRSRRTEGASATTAQGSRDRGQRLELEPAELGPGGHRLRGRWPAGARPRRPVPRACRARGRGRRSTLPADGDGDAGPDGRLVVGQVGLDAVVRSGIDGGEAVDARGPRGRLLVRERRPKEDDLDPGEGLAFLGDDPALDVRPSRAAPKGTARGLRMAGIIAAFFNGASSVFPGQRSVQLVRRRFCSRQL
ncbi:MAG: hypothetical protein MZV64_11145 [Ignavibacteriales bacterium]|nr:hypothetical protein [Ignavibacteriales bacterium]